MIEKILILSKSGFNLVAIVDTLSYSPISPVNLEFEDDLFSNKFYIKDSYHTDQFYYIRCEAYKGFFKELKIGVPYKVLRGGR